MRRHIILGVAVVAVSLAAACSSGSSTETTSPPVSASTSVGVTTTTAPATTTTTVPTTTTSIGPAGNWADVPLVVYDGWGGMALGWWDGSAWVQASEDTTLPISGDETYQVALLGSDVLIEGGPQHNLGCEDLGAAWPGVELTDVEALGTLIDDGAGGDRGISGVAVSAPWDIHTNPVSVGEESSDLQAAAFDLLAALDFTTDSVSIVQVLETDIDGDGAMESLAVAESTELANQASGVYSLVFVFGPSWDEPVVVAQSVIPATEEGFPESFRVSDVADLTGDGVMEVIISGWVWEGTFVGVYELTDDGFMARIGAGCGA
jgi:hypothetical protein